MAAVNISGQVGFEMHNNIIISTRGGVAVSEKNCIGSEYRNNTIKGNFNTGIEAINADGVSVEANHIDIKDPKLPKKMGRNEKCYCGSGLKFKRCHGRF